MKVIDASFYVTGGTLRRDAPSYVQRRADRDLYEGLVKGQFCYVLTSRQMGKSSLMVRTAVRLREEGISVAVLDLTAIGQNLSTEQWFDGLLSRIGQQLKLESELEQFWLDHERVGPLQRFMRAIREVVLAHCKGRVVIFIDEIDTVCSLPFSTDEFFAGIREFYNRRTEDPELERLTFCLLGVAIPSDLIRDARTTPFNIGERIELYDFTEEEAVSLAKGLGREGGLGEDLMKRILHWTGGHPYLTQRLCQAVAMDKNIKSGADVDRLCEEMFLTYRAREKDDNLLFVRERILRSDVDIAGLLDLYKKVRLNKKVPDDKTSVLINILRLSGITISENGFLKVRNRIYHRVFNKDWVLANMPGAELRRQRAAERRGLLRATGVSVVILAMMALLVFDARDKRNIAKLSADSAQMALIEAEKERKEAIRQRELAEQQKEIAEAQKAEAVKQSQRAIKEEQKRAAIEVQLLKANIDSAKRDAKDKQLFAERQIEVEKYQRQKAEDRNEINGKDLEIAKKDLEIARQRNEKINNRLLYSVKFEGSNALYNLDYGNAENVFKEIKETLPDHPVGNFYLANKLWLEQLNSNRRLQTDLYGINFFFQKNSNKVDEKRDKEFYQLTRAGLEQADASIKKNPNDIEALYFKGSIYALLALYDFTVKQSIRSALESGQKAVSLHRRVLEIDPNFYDAYLTIGMFEYISGYISKYSPASLKIPLEISGLGGSREKGLEYLQTVSDKGIFAKEDANVALAVLFVFEQRYDKAFKILDTLSARYPRNYLFRLERAKMLARLNRLDESSRALEELLADRTTQSITDLIHYNYGEVLERQMSYQEALYHYREVINLPNPDRDLVSRSRIKAGNMLDLLEKRREAISEYQGVLQSDDSPNLKDEARGFLVSPYRLPFTLGFDLPGLRGESVAASEFRKLRTDGFNSLYNMNYQGAKSKFELMTQLQPENPAGYLYLATNFLFDQLNMRRRLQIGLYSNNSFYAKGRDKIDVKTENEFLRLIDVALEQAENQLKKNPNNLEALYYKGATYGILALYEATVKRSFLPALRNGRKSVSLHRKVIEMDPKFVDSYLTIGTYDYIAGSLPFYLKILARIGGISGSRERGLKELQNVIETGRYNNDDARITLITLFAREGRFDEVLKQLDKLSEKYPNNYLFKLERANVLVKLKRTDESYRIFEDLLKDPLMRKAADLVHYQYGEALAGQKRYEDAIGQFRSVVNLVYSNSDLVTSSRLRTGNMFDLLQKRTEAIEEYQAVLLRDNVFDSQQQARRFLKSPYIAGSPK